jgi:molybdate transport system substrate-binding protein
MRGGMIQSFTRRMMLGGLAALTIGAAPAQRAPLVLAAASLQESLTAAADAWAGAGHPKPIISFAASSTLARQAEAGAPGDLFVSADEDWMDALAAKGLLAAGTRADLVGNRLVVVEPVGRRSAIPTSGPRLARVLGAGPLAMADPDSVPAGKYGKAALEKLGAWNAVAGKVVRAENVRAALALVERGAAPFGIVYLTDARASTRVRVAGLFPRSSHPPILYPIARLARSTNPEAEGFRRFLLSPRGRAIFARFGFGAPAK